MTRCAQCGGKLGLVRRYAYPFVMWGIPIRFSFCKDACRKQWEADRA